MASTIETTRKPGDVDVKRARISTHDRKRKFDIGFQMVSLKIFEDIFKNTMYGAVTFIDRMNSLQELPILGEEFFEIEFTVPFFPEKTFKAEFFIYAITDVVPSDDRKSQLVTLHFISVEHLENARKLVSFAFKNDSFSNHAKKLLTESFFLNSKKPIARWLDSGKINGAFTFPYQSSFEIIEYFRLNGYSLADPSSAYVFFENQNGFNFTTIDNLINDPINKQKIINLRHHSISQVNPREVPPEEIINTAQAVIYNNVNDTLESMKRGVFNAKATIFDFPNKTTVDKLYQIKEEFNRFSHLDNISSTSVPEGGRFRSAGQNIAGPKNSDYFIEQINKGNSADPVLYVGRNYLFPENSDRGVTGILDFAPRRAAYNELLQQLPLTIQMLGNPYMTAGNIVNLDIPVVTHNSTLLEKNELSRYISGKFLIGRVCHTIEIDSYKMTLNVFKESFKNKINPTDPFYAQSFGGPR